jgi:hypothetical protein
MATTIYSGVGDGDVYVTSSAGGTSWEDARDATSGTATSNAIRNDVAVKAVIIGSGRGTYYSVSRAFFIFDVSGITHVPLSARILIFGYGYGNADMRLVKSNQASTVANGDFDAIEGWVAGGDNRSNVTEYDTGEIATWSKTTYNTIHLSQQALVDIAGLTLFKCCLIESDHDLRDSAPVAPSGIINYSGLYYTDALGTAKDPKLVVYEQDNAVFMGANF